MVIALIAVAFIVGALLIFWIERFIFRFENKTAELYTSNTELKRQLNEMEWAMRLGMKSLLNGVYIRQGIYKIERKSLDDNNQYVYETRIIRQPFLSGGKLRGETKQRVQLVIRLNDDITKFEEATNDEKKEFVKEYNSHVEAYEARAW